MTKTNRALLLSVVSLILCASMLIGSTYAWFTDSASSASNVIQSGNLDIQVEYTLDGKTWADLDGADDLFQKGLWEPGHTEVVALRIKNNGSLALKYAASMNIVDETIGKTKDGEDIVLSDILTVTTVCQEANMVGDILLGMVFNGSQNTDTSNTTVLEGDKAHKQYWFDPFQFYLGGTSPLYYKHYTSGENDPYPSQAYPYVGAFPGGANGEQATGFNNWFGDCLHVSMDQPVLNTQIPKEDDWHQYDTQTVDAKAVLETLL